MGASGYTTIWNHDRISAEAHRRGGEVQKLFMAGHWSYYIYPNPFADDPAQIGVAYCDNADHSYTPMGLFFWCDKVSSLGGGIVDETDREFFKWSNTDFKTFKDYYYKRHFAGTSMDRKIKVDTLRQHFDFLQWACENALIDIWEVWT